jgi:hypothetical protein
LLLLIREGLVSPKLLAALRVCVLNEEDMKIAMGKKFDPMKEISVENERDMWNTFGVVLDNLLESFEEDANEEELNWAAQYRSNQKEILIYNKQFVKVEIH